jgi:hypothetical protein
MKEGQYVRHLRSPEYGVGKIAPCSRNGIKVIFPRITISGVLPHVLEAVSFDEQKWLEKEEAMLAGPEALAAWEKRQNQPKRPNQSHRDKMCRAIWEPRRIQRNIYPDIDEERLSMLLEAAINDSQPGGRTMEHNGEHHGERQTDQQADQQTGQQADSSWWYQAFRLSKAEDEDLSMETRIAGVTYENRQSIIADMEENEHVLLVREPENSFDDNAVSVKRINGRQIGYLPRELAAKVAPRLDAHGKPVSAVVTAILGRHYIEGTLGVRIRFSLAGIEQRAENCIATGEDNELPPF